MYAWTEGEKLFNIGNVIHGYNLSIFTGLLVCFGGIVFFWKRMKYSWTILQVMMMIAVPSGIFGARLWDVIWDGGWSDFFNFAGLSIHGGVLAGMIFTSPYVWYMRRQVDFRTVFSIVLPNILVAQAIGRFGNFFNHELFGELISTNKNDTTLDWMGLMKEHMWISSGGVEGYRQPMFFYESMSSLAGWAILVPFLLRKNWLRPGVIGALYWVWYGIWRTVFEPMKAQPWVVNGFPVATFISVLSIVLGLMLAAFWQFVHLFKNNEWKNPFLKSVLGWTKNMNDYERITPVKPRRVFEVFGKKTEEKHKYIFWGPMIPNKVILWIPKEKE